MTAPASAGRNGRKTATKSGGRHLPEGYGESQRVSLGQPCGRTASASAGRNGRKSATKSGGRHLPEGYGESQRVSLGQPWPSHAILSTNRVHCHFLMPQGSVI